jgi:hypothetical protein
MKKGVVITLTLMFVCSIAGTAFAATNADYAQELDSLKVRMAELEKMLKTSKAAPAKSDNKLSFAGSDFRIRWINDGADDGDSTFQERVRLNMDYKVNDNVTFNARWRVVNENEFGKTGSVGKDGYMLSDANVAMKNVMGTTMTMGRFSQNFGATGYWNSSAIGLIDGVKFTAGKDVKVTAGFANFGAFTSPKETITVTENSSGKHTVKVTDTHSPALEEAFFLNAAYSASKATTLYGMYVKEQSGADSDFDVKGLGIRTKINNDFQFYGDYTKNYGKDNHPAGYYLSLRWKGANDNVPGTFGMRLDYRKVENGNMFSALGQGVNIPTQKFQGPAISAHYAIAKNVLLEGYQTFDTKNADTGEEQPNYTRLQVTIGF